MAVQVLNLYDHAEVYYSGGQAYSTAQTTLRAGYDTSVEVGCCFRFDLPNDFNSTATINAATLDWSLNETSVSTSLASQIAVLASSTQNLPGTVSTVLTDAVGSVKLVIGSSAPYSGSYDYLVPGGGGNIAMNVKPMLEEAAAAARLNNDFVGFTFRYLSVGASSQNIYGSINPTLTLNYNPVIGDYLVPRIGSGLINYGRINRGLIQ